MASPIPEVPALNTDLPNGATSFVIDLTILMSYLYLAAYFPQFQHQTVVLMRSRNEPPTQVLRDLGISIDTLRNCVAQAFLTDASCGTAPARRRPFGNAVPATPSVRPRPEKCRSQSQRV